MYSFKNDYSEGAHTNILDAITRTNLEQFEGYGEDTYSKDARALLKKRIGKDDIDIHFLMGGTQTNLTAISAFLRPHEAVISANTGHILVHETGAIEATGHKIISVDKKDGKLNARDIKDVIVGHSDEHMVKPKLVYISNPTEIGSIYSKEELVEISEFCKNNDLIFYMDGARLGSALTSRENNVKLSDLGNLLDAFYIGGTKNGALFGEALVICSNELKKDFRFHIKQKGGLLAKGKLLGIQFYELFKENLYFDLAKNANDLAFLLNDEIKGMGFDFLIKSASNQVFPILPNEIIKKLHEKYLFYIWEAYDEEKSVIRLVTSWATKKEKVKEFLEDLDKVKNI